ncbi:MAG: S-layer homology domain-containing protein, partial [Clostridiales bacterium]|nr:S-layer homology domain-containing protein [Clostridiales bacterium]
SALTPAFHDEDDIASWALEAVRKIHAAGIVHGKPGNVYDPKGIATRAEMAAVFARLINR